MFKQDYSQGVGMLTLVNQPETQSTAEAEGDVINFAGIWLKKQSTVYIMTW